jgi:L-alanine-DL-glutamate epimerase-like enolase superfamily enzyme
LPQNYIAFEYPVGQPEWWYEIVDGLPNPIVKRGFIDVWDRPGLGVTFNVPAAKSHLSDEDRHFFDWEDEFPSACDPTARWESG